MHPLLQTIDLEYSGLTQVKAAVNAYDVSQALNALIEYYRNRLEPDPISLIDPDETFTTIADLALRHEFTFYNHQAVIPGSTIDWTYKPSPDWEWTWALNRHTWWPALASAYLTTKNEKYVQELDSLICSWVGEHPPSVHDLSAWRPLEAGIRMGKAWIRILQALKTSSQVSRTAWLYYLRSIYDHAEYLIKYAETSSNRLLMEMNGLLNCGLIFPEFKRASDWVHIAMKQLETEMQAQVHPDGLQNEYSTGYQLVCIDHFEDALEKVERASRKQFSSIYRNRLIAMWESVMYMLRPDGKLPMLNDADQRLISPQLIEAGEKYGRTDFIYAGTNGRQGQPPADNSHRFPWGRRAIMRSGWETDALYGLLETAPFGYGHQHEDALTFEVMAYGQPLIGTMGRFTYADTPIRRYLTSSRGHNVVLIDNHEQAQISYAQSISQRFDSAKPLDLQANAQRNQPPERMPASWIATVETMDPWISNDKFDVAHGKYEGPWSGQEKEFSWERWMIFHKPVKQINCPGFWVIQDRFLGHRTHELDFLFHFFPGEISWDEETGHIVSNYGKNTGNILVCFADPSDLTFAPYKGQENPPRGWFSQEYGQVEAAWEIVAQTERTFPFIHTFVLIPFYGDQVPDVQLNIIDIDVDVVIDGQSWNVPFKYLLNY